MAKTLLLVNDSVAIREVVGLTFENTDLTVRGASDLEEAWEILQEEGADIVVADADKPRIGGWELCRRIKEDPRLRAIPIVLFSGEDDEASRPWDVTPEALLSKPFSSDDLRKTVTALLGLEVMGESPENGPAREAPAEDARTERRMEEKSPLDFAEYMPMSEEEAFRPLSEPKPPSPRKGPAAKETAGAGPEVRSAIESAVRQALSESLKGLGEEELRGLIASAIRDALRDLTPQIAGMVERVAREVVPGLAEIWIEREIQRLKEEG